MDCRICSNGKDNQEYEAREMMYGYKDVFRYFQCSKCGCLQIMEVPLDMSRYYSGNYYSFGSIPKPNIVIRYLIRLRDRYAIFGRGLMGKFLYAFFPLSPIRSLYSVHPTTETYILDVGCGSGILLHSLRELGFKNILGVDPFIQKEIEYENGLRVRKLNIQEVEGKWDVVMFHHSFEHISDPKEALLRVCELLNTGGCCIIQTPTVSSYAWKHYGINWVQLDAPRHFFLHSLESIEILCKKTGFMLSDVIYNSTAFQFWGSEQYIRDIPLHDKRSWGNASRNSIFSKNELSTFAKHAEMLNAFKQGDQALFYLRKL